MNELIIALGLVLVIEGLPWAIAPKFGKNFFANVSTIPENALRIGGLVMITAGVVLVWLVRG